MTDLLIMKKRIMLEQSPVLYDTPFTPESLAADWQVRGGAWRVEDAWLSGRNPDNSPGMITSRREFFGNVLLDFEARVAPPCTHDIDWMWNGSWDDAKQERGLSYICGIEGWWEGKVGFEKSPDYTFVAATPLFTFEPGRTYHIQSGSIDGHVFTFIDGQLIIELTDPFPIDHSRYGMIGFEAYASMPQIRNLVVRQIVWEVRPQSYAPEF